MYVYWIIFTPRHDMYCREIAIFHVQSVSGAPTEGDGELTEFSLRSLATEQYSPWDCSYIRDFIFLPYGKCQLKILEWYFIYVK